MLGDALLLDPWRDSREIWISARTDQRGSGTQSDPFSGGKRFTPSVSVSITWDGNALYQVQAVASQAINQPPHSYATAQAITISGAADAAYNGTFAIDQVVDAVTFKFTLRSAPAGNAGSPSCFKTIYLFDEVMRSLPANTAIHIGPGTFETRGEGEGQPIENVGWRLLNGWRIAGSGIGATTLKLVGAYVRNLHYSIIGTQTDEFLQDGCEVRDLTLDCNVDGQAGLYIAAGGVTLRGGSRYRLRHHHY